MAGLRRFGTAGLRTPRGARAPTTDGRAPGTCPQAGSRPGPPLRPPPPAAARPLGALRHGAGGASADGPHGQGRRRNGGRGVRAGRRRFSPQAVPSARAVGAAGRGVGPPPDVTGTAVRFVDVYVLRDAPADPAVLVLRRARAGRSPGTWEAVHGAIEIGETAVQAALRELREEPGLAPARVYNASRVEAFSRHAQDQAAFIPLLLALLAPRAAVRVSAEHDAFEWLAPAAALARVTWARMRRALEGSLRLFGQGGGNLGGVLDGVFRGL